MLNGEYCVCFVFDLAEISAVLLNTENGETEDQFHSYVKPVINPELSKYCIDTTGITQEMVDDEEEFLDVYKDFNSWLGHIKSGRNLNFATPLHRNAAKDGPNIMFCSWNSSTLNEHFKKELQRAKTAIPPILMTWTDVIKLYRVCVIQIISDSTPYGLSCTLTDLNLKSIFSTDCLHRGWSRNAV